MKEIILIKNGEIALKGLNKNTFEDTMIRNIRRRMRHLGKVDIKKSQSTVTISSNDEFFDMDAAFDIVSRVFGVSAFCRACEIEKDMQTICKTAAEYLANELIFADAGKISKHPLPALVMPGAERTLHYDLVTAEMAAKFENCSFVEGSVFDKLSHTPYLSYLLVNQPGNKITVKFTGTELALLMSDYTSGTVKYTVDGKNGSEVRNSMNNPFPLISGLEYGEHTAVIEICFDKVLETDNGKRYRFSESNGSTLLETYFEDAFTPLMAFYQVPFEPVDFIALNSYCTSSKQQPFINRRMVHLCTPDGKISVDGDFLRINKNGAVTETPLLTDADLHSVLKSQFGIVYNGNLI